MSKTGNIAGRRGIAGSDAGARAHTKPTQLSTPSGKRQQVVDQVYTRTPMTPLRDGQFTGPRRGQS